LTRRSGAADTGARAVLRGARPGGRRPGNAVLLKISIVMSAPSRIPATRAP
jgi:hypothetical protein